MPKSPVQRRFVDWSLPTLQTAAAELAQRFRDGNRLDLGNVWIVLPGQRAQRRMMELLVEYAEADALALTPPRLLTEGPLANALSDDGRALASDCMQLLAWLDALESMPKESLSEVLPQPPAAHDLSGWIAIARTLDGLHRQLAANDLCFSDVVRLAAESIGPLECRRWKALQQAQDLYLATLARHGYADPEQRRRDALGKPAHLPTDKRPAAIVLVGVVDLPNVTRGLLSLAQVELIAFVQAPIDLAAGFDEFGCLATAPWLARPIELQEDRLIAADGPEHQAAAVVEALREAVEGASLTAEDVVIAANDDDVVASLRSALAAHDISTHASDGIALSLTRPYRLLDGVSELLATRQASALCNLLRNPDFSGALSRLAAQRKSRRYQDPLTAMDNYWTLHLPSLLTDRWASLENVDAQDAGVVEFVWSLAKELLAELMPTDSEERRPLAEWAAPICNLLLTAFGSDELNPGEDPDRVVLEACRSLRDPLVEFQTLAPELARATTAPAAIALALELAERSSIPEAQAENAIDLIGWLDLRLEDARVAVATSLNEGKIPESVVADAFLPNGLRQQLGLLDNDRRFARDAYAMQAIVAARPNTTWVIGKRTAQNETLAPSRLLFACPKDRLADRVRRFFRGKGDIALLEPVSTHEPNEPFGQLIEPKRGKGLSKLSATGFRAYLACPYRFYLSHVLRLGAVNDEARELDGAVFGGLAHDILASFGAELPNRSLRDVDAIRKRLRDILDDQAARRFAGNALPAVGVQLEQLRDRFDQFAIKQAGQVAAGWRIHATEQWADATIEVQGKPFVVHGRIDRIDWHPTDGWMVWDYKTSEGGDGPERTHRRRSGEWIDFQLPIYRELARAWLTANGHKDSLDKISVGYVLLPRDLGKTAFAVAQWSEDDFASAMAQVREIAAAVQAGIYWPPNPDAPPYDDFAAICALAELAN